MLFKSSSIAALLSTLILMSSCGSHDLSHYDDMHSSWNKPSVSFVSPSSGQMGEEVRVYGRNLSNETVIYIGGSICPQRTIFNSDMRISCTLGTYAPGTLDLVVRHGNISEPLYRGTFTYTVSLSSSWTRPTWTINDDTILDSWRTPILIPTPVQTPRPTPALIDPLPRSSTTPVYEETFSPTELTRFRSSASHRIRLRQININSLRGNNAEWSAGETIMSPQVTLRYLESLTRLEERYPYAISLAERAFVEVYNETLRFTPPAQSPQGRYIKSAALRFLNRARSQTIFSDEATSDLSYKQVIALAWIAIHDQAIYTTPLSRNNKIWEMIVSFGTIQRAHNDTSTTIDGHINTDGFLNFDQDHHPDNRHRADPDQPSCSQGTYKRLLEFLHDNHPDVRIYSLAPSNAELTSAVAANHRSLFDTLPSAEQDPIRRGVEDDATTDDRAAYDQYVARLRNRILENVLGSTVDQVHRLTDREMVMSNIDF